MIIENLYLDYSITNGLVVTSTKVGVYTNANGQECYCSGNAISKIELRIVNIFWSIQSHNKLWQYNCRFYI